MTHHHETLCEAVVEIPKGARHRYAYDGETGFFRLTGVYYSPLQHPTDYGFIRHTCAGNGQPLACFIFISHPTFPGCLLAVRVIGGYGLEGKEPSGLLTVAVADPRYEKVEELRHLSPYSLREIECFFAACYQLEGKKIPPVTWYNRETALEVLQLAQKRWQEGPKVVGAGVNAKGPGR